MKKILALNLVLILFLFFISSSHAEIKVFFSPKSDIAEEIIKQIDNAQEYIDIVVIQDRHAGIMHNKTAIIDGRVLFTGSYNWSKSAEERNEENLLEFIDEEQITKIYRERLDYLWEFNEGK